MLKTFIIDKIWSNVTYYLGRVFWTKIYLIISYNRLSENKMGKLLCCGLTRLCTTNPALCFNHTSFGTNMIPHCGLSPHGYCVTLRCTLPMIGTWLMASPLVFHLSYSIMCDLKIYLSLCVPFVLVIAF